VLSSIKFHLTRLYVHLYVLWKELTNDPWEAVEGIYLPVTRDIGFSTLRWIVSNQYEAGEITIIKNTLEDGDRVLEIGTGLGFVAAFCCRKTGSQNVYTFEANPANIAIADKVFLKNLVNPNRYNALLAAENGEVEFPVNLQNRLASSLSDSQANMITVNAVRLNDFVASVKPNFLIMDIEGGEYDIIKIIHFQSIRKIQFELHPVMLGEQKCVEIFKILEQAGFEKDKTLSDDRNFFFQR
jgi:FkbM family methyltransferase